MTCKDCIHHNLCDANECLQVVTDIIDDSINNIYLGNVQNRCAFFKNKADVVEVVRCKDCKHYKTDSYYCKKTKKGYCELDNNVRQKQGYCSYGERKCDKDD